jgi:hypothetical protein
MSQTAPAQARTGNRRHRGILALLAGPACLAGPIMGELTTSPSGPVAARAQATSPSGTVTPQAGTAAPSQEQLGAVSWPADGASATDTSGIGVTDGPGATRQVPIASVAKLMTAYVPDPPADRATFGQPGTAGTILQHALQAGRDLVLALDRALGAGGQSGSRDDSEGPLQGPPGAP